MIHRAGFPGRRWRRARPRRQLLARSGSRDRSRDDGEAQSRRLSRSRSREPESKSEPGSDTRHLRHLGVTPRDLPATPRDLESAASGALDRRRRGTLVAAPPLAGAVLGGRGRAVARAAPPVTSAMFSAGMRCFRHGRPAGRRRNAVTCRLGDRHGSPVRAVFRCPSVETGELRQGVEHSSFPHILHFYSSYPTFNGNRSGIVYITFCLFHRHRAALFYCLLSRVTGAPFLFRPRLAHAPIWQFSGTAVFLFGRHCLNHRPPIYLQTPSVASLQRPGSKWAPITAAPSSAEISDRKLSRSEPVAVGRALNRKGSGRVGLEMMARSHRSPHKFQLSSPGSMMNLRVFRDEKAAG